LQTIFQFLDCCDWLWFEPRTDGVIARHGEVVGVPPEADLTVRAARLLQQTTGIGRGALIRIDKRLPMGGGLGGGSSDAATTLVALNHYWQTGLTLTELAELGLRLGADVPVFVHGRAAWAEGVGERLTPLNLDEPWFVVLVPACHVATGAVFNDSELTRNSSLITITDFMMGAGGNDCEAVGVPPLPGSRRRRKLAGAARADTLDRYRSMRVRLLSERRPCPVRVGSAATGLERVRCPWPQPFATARAPDAGTRRVCLKRLRYSWAVAKR
jgi:4-diphosphocytidyl-2C-methyl-D-erythritol kinase